MSTPFVSILMLTYNAPRYVRKAVTSVRKRTAGVDFELVIVDNASKSRTVELVQRLHEQGHVDTLKLMDRNTLFAEGNNIAASVASPRATHYLLLNSDVVVRSDDWLTHLLANHRRGATSYGIAGGELERLDGYCYLIDADLYRSHPLNEGHQWWWAITRQQGELLSAGHSARGYRHHEKWLHHYGGKSGDGFTGAHGMVVTPDEVASWFNGHRPEIIDA